MKYYPRKLQKKLYPWLDNPDAIIILGARQVGKTSLLELLRKDLIKKWGAAKNIITYNLEDSDQLAALNRDPKYFKEYLIFSGADPQKESVIMIDEVQYLNDPSHFLKYLADFEPTLKLIVTGSTSLAIKRFKDGMTGRKKTFTLFPLDFQEFLLFKENGMLSAVLEEFHFRNLLLKKGEIDPERIKPFNHIFLFGEEATLVPAFDISETEKEYMITGEIPGIDVKDLDITLLDGMLTIKGEKKKEKEDTDENYHRIERHYGSFQRNFRIPEKVKTDKLDATYKDGVLKLTLPKAEASEAKKIEVKEEGKKKK